MHHSQDQSLLSFPKVTISSSCPCGSDFVLHLCRPLQFSATKGPSHLLPGWTLVPFAQHQVQHQRGGQGELQVGWKREQVMNQAEPCKIPLPGLHCTKCRTLSSKGMEYESNYFQVSPRERAGLFH